MGCYNYTYNFIGRLERLNAYVTRKDIGRKGLWSFLRHSQTADRKSQNEEESVSITCNIAGHFPGIGVTWGSGARGSCPLPAVLLPSYTYVALPPLQSIIAKLYLCCPAPSPQYYCQAIPMLPCPLPAVLLPSYTYVALPPPHNIIAKLYLCRPAPTPRIIAKLRPIRAAPPPQKNSPL
jgi:hypothetical protein